jgi:hypothetical protein
MVVPEAPDSVQIDGVVETSDTVSPEVAEALILTDVPPSGMSFTAAKLIV